ncbi:unnamed protein product [Alopecurus aequalis]
MEEKRTKLCFSIPPTKPKTPKPTVCPAAFSAAAAPHPSPAPRFITTFDPSQTLTPPAAPAIVMAPLPNSRNPSTVPTSGGPAFELAASDDGPSSSAGYGLAVRGTEESKREKDAAAARRFKQDMAVLPDIDEYEEVPVEGFGAALLAGYGWKEGNAIGRDKSKGDVKVVERGRRSGASGLGADPLDTIDSAVRPVVRRGVRDLRDCSCCS